LLLVFGEFFDGENVTREVEASPGAPGAKFGSGAGHASGKVLEVADGVADEEVGVTVF